MSESILNALVHLFAIVANINVEGVSSKGKKIVKLYLQRYLSGALVDEYLSLFNNYYDFYRREIKDDSAKNQNESIVELISSQLTNVCEQIQKGLLRKERVIVFLQLLEFVYDDFVLTDEEAAFIEIVGKTFNLLPDEINDFESFIFSTNPEDLDKERVLVIDNQLTEWAENLAWLMKNRSQQSKSDFKHIYRKNLYGKIIVLHIPSVNAFVFRYVGELNIYVEGNKVIPGRAYFLNSGSIIKGPNIESIYYNEIASYFLGTSEDEKITLTAKNIEFSFYNSDNGIKEFSFSEESGQLIGIMGGSGVGKSTLLNVLSGKLPLHGGKILINKYDIHSNKSEAKGLIGFVPQDDLLFEELTVYQNLYYNTKLCFSDYSEQDIVEKVETIIADLDLQDIKHLRVGNPLNKFISGGQRKRLNIALELIREPSILFIDEPTSGLSSMDSEKVMTLLKDQAQKGKLVIANIHQPSSDIFKLFDKLWILDKGGYPIYQGNPIDAIVYFKTITVQVNAAESECSHCGNINPDQILKIVEAKKINDFGKEIRERKTSPETWYHHYKENIETKINLKQRDSELPSYDFKVPNLIKQFKVFFMRNFLSKLTNTQYIIINLIEAPLLAMILGFFSKYVTDSGYILAENKNIPVYLFMSVVVALFLGLTVSAEEIIKDRKILEREVFLNLSRFSYINSKIVTLFGLSAIQALLYVIIGNSILEINGMLWKYWLILFTASCMGNMLGLNISSALDSVIAIYILIPLILVPQLLLGGAMIKYDDLHKSLTSKIYVPIIANFMTTRWAYEALAVEQFKGNNFEKHFFEGERTISQNDYYASYLIPRLQNDIIDISETYKKVEEKAYNEEMLERLRNEFVYLAQESDNPPFDGLEYLNLIDFSESIGEEAYHYLEFIQEDFSEIRDNAIQEKEEAYEALIEDIGEEEFIKLKRDNHNKSLADIVLNRDNLQKIYISKKRYIQKKDPVYMKPISDVGRAHFYAPVKVVRGREIDTLWFNILMMWMGSLILYILLLYDVLRRIILYFEYLKFKE